MRDVLRRAPGLLLALSVPVAILATLTLTGCGGGDPAETARQPVIPEGEPIRIGDDSPLDQLDLGADPGQG